MPTPSQEINQIEAGLAALELQRAVLGDAVVDLAAAPLRARLESLRQDAGAANQHRKQVSVLFVDIVGSTAMTRSLDPEDAHQILDRAMQRFTTVVEAHQGRVLQYAGDGLLAAFGADEVREDDAERAVRAGLAIGEAARELARSLRSSHGLADFQIRAGIDTGPALLGGGVDAEGSIRGAVVALAARMEQTAPPGGLRIHHDTQRHVRGVFKVTEEPVEVKGEPQPVRTYLVHGVKPRAFRVANRGIEGLQTRMVAREEELEELQSQFDALCRQRRAIVVHVVAEAGLGKSRLLAEFEDWAEAQPTDFFLFRGRAEPQTRAHPFGLMHDLLAWRLQIADDDDPATARRKLVDGIAPLFGPDDGEAPAQILGHLLGLDFGDSPALRGLADDARELRNRAFHIGAEVLRRTAARAGMPILMVLEDLHWADDGSLDFLQYVIQVGRDVPMLMVCALRPGLYERRPDWALPDAAHVRIELQPLDKRAGRELAGELLRRLGTVPPALRELLIGSAEGNPFHMEELLRMLIDDGVIDTDSEPWQLQADRLLATQVPPTLAGVLQARLDSLPPDERHALQLCAVIGHQFWEQALAAIDPDAPPRLRALAQRGLITAHDQAALDGQKEYVFAHQALHQVTYDSVLRRQRAELHGQVADWLLRMRGGRPSQALGLAAGHLERAGDPAGAARCYVRAAEDAAARYANAAMRRFVGRGLDLAAADDTDSRWRLLLLRERQGLDHGDGPAHEADLAALAELAEASHDDGRRATVALRRAAAHRAAGDYAAAVADCHDGLARAGADGATVLALHHSLAETLIGLGRYDEARTVAEAGLQRARESHNPQAEQHLINALGLIAMEQGDLLVAAGHFERSLAMARAMGQLTEEGAFLNNLGAVYPMLGEYERARECLEAGLQVARQTGRRSTEASLLLNTASVAHLQGDDTAALGFAHAALDHAVASGQRDLEAFAHAVTGHAQLGLGRLDAARQAYSTAHAMLDALTLRDQQVLDPVSGLARVELAAGRLDEAMLHALKLLAHIDAGGSFDGTEEPLLVPLSCYRVLAAAGHPRADAVLAWTHEALQAKAARIADPRAREGFLERVPHHREILQAWLARPAGLAA